MSILILYYSRTGNTKKLAEALAKRLGADIGEIICHDYDGGAVRFMLAGYHSLTGKLPDIELPEIANDPYDLVLVGGPIWTSYPALPIRAFLTEHREIGRHIGFFLTLGGQSPPQKALDALTELAGRQPVATLCCSSDEMADDSYMKKLEPFAARLGVTT